MACVLVTFLIVFLKAQGTLELRGYMPECWEVMMAEMGGQLITLYWKSGSK